MIGKYYWSREPGKFVNKMTGEPVLISSSSINNALMGGFCFTGTVREWDETLVETIIDACNHLYKGSSAWPNEHRFTEVSCSSDVCTILMCSVLFRLNSDELMVTYETFVGKIMQTRVLMNVSKDWPRNLIKVRSWLPPNLDGTPQEFDIEVLDMKMI